jgi:hypothetical protein
MFHDHFAILRAAASWPRFVSGNQFTRSSPFRSLEFTFATQSLTAIRLHAIDPRNSKPKTKHATETIQRAWPWRDY